MSDQQNHLDIVSILTKVNIFAELSQDLEALGQIAKMMVPRAYELGDSIIKQGEPGRELFVLIKGQIAIYKKTPDGDSYKVIVLFSKDHPSIGEGGLIGGEVRSASVVCESAVECLVLKQDDFEGYCSRHSEQALPIVKKIALSLMARLNQTSHDLMLLHSALMKEIRSA
jgi:CRP-like cAMP-binding protein